jgi:hypothetical protein
MLKIWDILHASDCVEAGEVLQHWYRNSNSVLWIANALWFTVSRVQGSVTNNNGLWIGWLDLLTPYRVTQFGTAGNTELSLFYRLYSSPLHTHYDSQSSLVVSWQRIYKPFHCHFKSHLKSSLRRQIHFLSLFCNCQFRSLDSILFPSSYPGSLASRNSTQFFSIELFFITTLHVSRRKHRLSVVGKV